MQKIRKPDDIVADFNGVIRELISRLEKKSRSDFEIATLDRLKKRIILLKSTLGQSALIESAAPFFIDYSEQILCRDENFFNNMDVRKKIFETKSTRMDKDDEFLLSLIDMIKKYYNKVAQSEKDAVYSDVKNLFNNSVEFQIASM